jgi:peptidoglycan/LPS O-acetylase OafA/YrhL
LIERKQNHFDELRLLSAWFVLFSHCYPLTGQAYGDPFARLTRLDTLGGVGVCIFFVLSGYLVTLSWQRSDSVSDFVWKRLRRIFPALVACVLVCTFLLGLLLTTLPISEYLSHKQTWDYLRTATGWEIRFALPGVFATVPHTNVVNGSLWSLPYEIHCYLALIVIGVLPLRLRWKTMFFAIGLVVAFIVRSNHSTTAPGSVFLGMDYYTNKLGICFAIGAVVASWKSVVGDQTKWLWLAILGFALSVSVPPSALREVSYLVTLSLLALAVALHSPWVPHFPEKMGDWSYGLYLWAFPIQQIIVQTTWSSERSFYHYLALTSALSFAIAAASWYSIERHWLTKESSSLGWIRKRN